MSEPASDGETADRYDVLRYVGDDRRVVPAGRGQQVVAAHESEARKRRQMGALTIGILLSILFAVGGVSVLDSLPLALGVGVAVGVAGGAVRYGSQNHDRMVPELVVSDAAERLVREHVDEFDPDAVSDPFE